MKKIAFSLVELMVTLVVLSVIVSALAPIITKKLKNNAPPKNLNFRTLPEGGNRHFYDAAKMKAIDEALIHHHNLDIDIKRAPMISA